MSPNERMPRCFARANALQTDHRRQQRHRAAKPLAGPQQGASAHGSALRGDAPSSVRMPGRHAERTPANVPTKSILYSAVNIFDASAYTHEPFFSQSWQHWPSRLRRCRCQGSPYRYRRCVQRVFKHAAASDAQQRRRRGNVGFDPAGRSPEDMCHRKLPR